MKTLLLAPELFASDGGIPRILRLYLKALCQLAGPADRVRFLSLNDALIDSHDLRRYTNDRLDLWETCSRDKMRFVRAGLHFARRVDRIVCGHVAQLPLAWAATRFRSETPYYLVAHGIEVWRHFTFLERVALRGARRILCISDHTRRELARHIQLRPEQLVVLPNALDPSFENRADPATRSATPHAPIIVTVSRLTRDDRYKGIDSLINAMPALLASHPRARLRIIGRGDDLPRLQAQAQALGLNGAVEFLGYVEDTVMQSHLAACSLFALPSEKEGFGLVFLEAMAHGKPCLGANAGGVPEVIDETCGRLVPYGDTAAIAATCSQMIMTKWDAVAICERATETFGYATFRRKLAELLSA